MNEHTIPVRTYFIIYLALMFLLALTIAVAFVNLGPFSVIVALAIAAVKAILILLYFMHVRFSSALTKLFAFAGFFWLLILFSLTFHDYLTRQWLTGPGH
jgi:cytochrome c oxidase subunit 4